MKLIDAIKRAYEGRGWACNQYFTSEGDCCALGAAMYGCKGDDAKPMWEETETPILTMADMLGVGASTAKKLIEQVPEINDSLVREQVHKEFLEKYNLVGDVPPHMSKEWVQFLRERGKELVIEAIANEPTLANVEVTCE